MALNRPYKLIFRYDFFKTTTFKIFCIFKNHLEVIKITKKIYVIRSPKDHHRWQYLIFARSKQVQPHHIVTIDYYKTLSICTNMKESCNQNFQL
jgi:hypothetical protein